MYTVYMQLYFCRLDSELAEMEKKQSLPRRWLTSDKSTRTVRILFCSVNLNNYFCWCGKLVRGGCIYLTLKGSMQVIYYVVSRQNSENVNACMYMFGYQ